MTPKRYVMLHVVAVTFTAMLLLHGCASRQGPHEGDLLDNKVLTGMVKSAEEKPRAEAVARNVSRTYGFKIGRLNVYQVLMIKSAGGVSGLPLTRRDWYAG